MKSIRLFLITFFTLPVFFGCNKVNKINTLYAYFNSDEREVINIDKNDLNELMENKQTFVLVQSTRQCHCSDIFLEIVNQFIKRDGLCIYNIDYEEIKKASYDFSIKSDSPTFHLIQNGNNLSHLEQINKSSSDEFFNKYDAFANFMDAHVAKPSFYYVNENELDNLYNGDDAFAIYFAKMGCSECAYLNNIILNQYAQEHMDMKKMYLFDFSKVAAKDFDSLREKYGLAESSNPTWGYGKGAIPLIQYVKPDGDHLIKNAIKQAFTFGNDILDASYKVNKSYFDLARISKIEYTVIQNQVGKQYKADETTFDEDHNIVLKNTVNEKIYKQAFIDFMNFLNNKLR